MITSSSSAATLGINCGFCIFCRKKVKRDMHFVVTSCTNIKEQNLLILISFM